MLASFLSALLFFAFATGKGCFSEKNYEKEVYNASATDTLRYNLREASHTIFFATPELKEVSGLSPTHQPGVFCAVQDEKGILFFVDAAGGGAILNRIFFHEKGDFEGVEMVGKSMFAVQSDGDLFEIKNWETPGAKPDIIKHESPLKKTDDVEGLAYDARRNALLLACKGNPDSALARPVYAFDLKTKMLNEKPVFSINPLEIEQLLGTDGKEADRWFAPSGIAIHPKTGDIYVLSSVKKRLVVLDYQTNSIKYAAQLSKKILPQPEGIAFDAEGNLYLSSEGKSGEGLLLRFDLR